MSRVVTKPGGFTFSDGTVLPQGTFVSVASHAIHHDGDNYGPDLFDGFRFANMRDAGDAGESNKHQMVNTDLAYIPFGHGRHSCPGRSVMFQSHHFIHFLSSHWLDMLFLHPHDLIYTITDFLRPLSSKRCWPISSQLTRWSSRMDYDHLISGLALLAYPTEARKLCSGNVNPNHEAQPVYSVYDITARLVSFVLYIFVNDAMRRNEVLRAPLLSLLRAKLYSPTALNLCRVSPPVRIGW